MTLADYTYSHLNALEAARRNNTAHSLLTTRRYWQHLGTQCGVSAWGYAYDGGKFNL